MSENQSKQTAELLLKHIVYYKLPPVLKTKKQLVEFLDFYYSYYAKDSRLTLKNAGNYIDFIDFTGSKIHSWLQKISYSLRIALLCENKSSESFGINEALAFFNKNCPKSPLVLKSALDKYKFIPITKWDSKQFEYCCYKEAESIIKKIELPGFVSKTFQNYSVKNEILASLQDLLLASAELDSSGNFLLSEKIFKSAENLAEKLGINYD